MWFGVSTNPRPVRLAAAREDPEPSCPLGVCDGSGWILGPEDVARPCECRERRMARRRARGVASAIPRKYRTVSFDAPPVSDMARDPMTAAVFKAVKDFVDRIDDHLAEGRGLWLMGDVGTGKTTLAMLVSKAAVEAGHTVAIYSLPRLLSRIRRTYDAEAGEQSYLEFFERLTEVDLLHIDDLGAEKRSDWVLEQLYAIVNERYEAQRSVVVTTNLNEDKLREQIGERTVSRLVEMCRNNVIPMWFDKDMRDRVA
jgi:DNA replication protein DnaC